MSFNRNKIKFAVLAFMSFLTACATGPTQEQLSNADYGRDIPTDECTTTAQHIVADSLKDPSSAQFRNTQCFKGYWGSAPILGLDVAFGWIERGEVNGKNAFGGYVGFRPYQVLIKDGSVVRYCITDQNGLCVPAGH